jgi:hypothetical protein
MMTDTRQLIDLNDPRLTKRERETLRNLWYRLTGGTPRGWPDNYARTGAIVTKEASEHGDKSECPEGEMVRWHKLAR